MKKAIIFAAVAMTMVGCSSDELVSNSTENNEAPIAFSVEKKNITRGTNLETLGHYNFGVWARKVNGKNSLADAEVMNNYLVGYSDESVKGYNTKGASTYNKQAGTLDDHLSPWFYEHLGTSEYEDGSYGYKTTDKDYMSNNANQYLRYWDLAYANTNFYAYAPYVKKDAENGKEVTFDHEKGEMKFADKTIRDGYDETLNTDYTVYDRSLSEFMYASVQAENVQCQDVVVPFKHMGAQLFVRFYEDIPGYKVELIDLGEDHGTMVSSATGDLKKGIQVTPAKQNGTSYESAEYYTTQGVTIEFDDNAAVTTYTPSWTNSTKVSANLMFQVPAEGKTTSTDAPANLADYKGHKIIKEFEKASTQEYSYSPTIYYAVAQPKTSETGLTFHVSYRIIAEDNQEVITVHNATVYVPAYTKVGEDTTYIAAWQPNNKYTYTFKITKNSTGTTNPETPIDPTNPTTSTTKGLYPIVFDGATVEDYTVKTPVSEISKEGDTNY